MPESVTVTLASIGFGAGLAVAVGGLLLNVVALATQGRSSLPGWRMVVMGSGLMLIGLGVAMASVMHDLLSWLGVLLATPIVLAGVLILAMSTRLKMGRRPGNSKRPPVE